MLAPDFDNALGNLPWSIDYIDTRIYNSLISIYQSMTCIQPGEHDEYRGIWFELPRGSISDYGDYQEFQEEGMVNSKKDFHELWEYDYPSESKWYKLDITEYDSNLYFYLDLNLLIRIPKKNESVLKPVAVPEEYVIVADSLSNSIIDEVSKLQSNEDKWNLNLETHLSYNRRYGRINRSQFWNIIGDDAIRADQELGKDAIEKLSLLIDDIKKNENSLVPPEITANQFLRYCEIGYDANDYFSGEQLNLSPKKKYLAMADGRHDGLLDIDGDSPKEFSKWYHHQMGGHPWEICRGGNSTHISLYIHKSQNHWQLTLAGSSIGRVVEAVRIAVALYDNGIPFSLRDSDAILRMVNGEDYIGIVPKEILPRYCHSHFPSEDKIIDFINLPLEYIDEIQKQATWYPEDRIVLI